MECDNPDEELRSERPSKSALKREAESLQRLGGELAGLNPRQLATLPLPARLSESIRELHSIKSNGAKRRQMQYIGRLMREIDIEPIIAKLNQLRDEADGATAAFHRLEVWRERLISEGDSALGDWIDRHPNGDRQQLRQAVRDAQREQKSGKPAGAGRKLFRLLRQMSE
jgi:ribosome-associated protein